MIPAVVVAMSFGRLPETIRYSADNDLPSRHLKMGIHQACPQRVRAFLGRLKDDRLAAPVRTGKSHVLASEQTYGKPNTRPVISKA